MKKVITLLLIAIAFGGAAMALKNQLDQPVSVATVSAPSAETEAPPEQTQKPDTARADSVIKVTYFTTEVRCPSCLRIEDWTRQTVETRFPDQVEEGTVAFKMINVNLPQNRHYIQDYQLVSKSVVVAEFKNGELGQWFNLQDVWIKLSDQAAFEAYVGDTVKALL